MFFYEESEYLSFSEEDTQQEENKVSLGWVSHVVH